MEEDKKLKKKKLTIIFSILFMVIILLGSTYAFFTYSKSVSAFTLTSNRIKAEFIEGTNSINITNAYPISDEFALANLDKLSYLDFTISSEVSNEDQVVTYEIYLTEDTNNTLDSNYIKVYLTDDSNNKITGPTIYNSLDYTSYPSDATTGKLIYKGNNPGTKSKNFRLYAWIDKDYEQNSVSQVFKFSVNIYAYNDDFRDLSGANPPELLDNMIPVYYDATSATEGVWRVADANNKKANYKWYDYRDFMWANAVTVKESGTKTRSEYLSSAVGTEISMDDITTMWVWIPRYKYTIWSGNNETSEEQLIKVEFEEGKNTTGTVTCVDNILVDENSSSSETCTDATYGSIINGISTYTHPAFTFGDTELTGFWYAKFEMSTDQDSTCVTSQSNANCNVTGQNIYVKPDQISLRYINNANIFVNIRNMELFNNVHGFTQSSSATTSSSQTGEITNDTNDYDIHMQKNMEWGAVTYLSYSKYGKYGNSLYTDTYKRVYKNNWKSVTDSVYTYKTGYSGYNYDADESTSNTVLYNDLTNLGSGQGYKGAGASTTGTIYGIYDMNGGGVDRTMGNMVDSSGNFYSANAGFSSNPLEKYYDKYSYNSNSMNSQDSITRGKLGDATKEMTKEFTNGRGSWDENLRNLPYFSSYAYSWIDRGGFATLSYFGLSLSGITQGENATNGSSRPVLVCLRDTLQ